MLNLHKLLPDDHAKLQLYRNITALKLTKEFQAFKKFLSDTHQSIDADNRKAQAPLLQWQQGASQFLQELDELISDSEKNAKQLQEKANPQR